MAMPPAGHTGLIRCVEGKDYEGLKTLLNAGAAVDQENSEGQTALIIAIHLSRRHRFVKALLRAGASPNTTYLNNACLGVAAAQGQAPCVQLLLAYGAEVNREDELGRTALELALLNPNPRMMQVIVALIAGGANVNHMYWALGSNNGGTPLHLATAIDNAEAVFALLRAGANRELRWKNHTALDRANEDGKSLVALVLAHYSEQ
jgi:uncharacterized protein